MLTGCFGRSADEQHDKRVYRAIQHDSFLTTRPREAIEVERWAAAPCTNDSTDQGEAAITYRLAWSRKNLVAFYTHLFDLGNGWTRPILYRPSEPSGWYLVATKTLEGQKVIANVVPSRIRSHEYTLSLFFDPRQRCGLL